MSKIKGGRKKTTTNLELRRQSWDAMSQDKQRRTKRPGSNKK